jgi:putative flavoprotein involved in K+ transport
MSTLKGYRMPRRYGRWPTRDQVVEYLEEYARREKLRIEFETEAKRITSSNGGWVVQTSAGEVTAESVVVAVGYDHDPVIPDWPGREAFAGELLHASEYREPAPFRDRDVLVVSAGNTGSEISYELVRSGARRVRTAMRSTPNVFSREWLRMPTPLIAAPMDYLPVKVADRMSFLAQRVMIGDLSGIGLAPATHGLATNVIKRHVAPVIDAGFVDAVKAGEIELVPAVEAFDGPDVILANGERIQPEVVIAATGYSRGLEPLVGHLGVLGPDGEPTHRGVPANPAASGLYFVGYGLWLRGQLPRTSRDTRGVARAIAKELG